VRKHLKENKKPYIILSAAMTIDGKIASKSGDPDLSDEQDWKEVHKLRTQVDAIMVGKGTILKDDPKLHIKYYEHNGYHRVILDSSLSIPISSKVITYRPEVYPTIICTTENVDQKKIKQFEKKNVAIVTSGREKRVDIQALLPRLYDLGIKSILLEGGGTLNWGFVELGLINEMRLTIAPWIIGGETAVSLVEGIGFERMKNALKFDLISVNARENYVTLNYKKKNEK
jgi:2,5-diamino-6-(ribosylamino)-4(3H)-pyrimidinone 5'-phosphate reductase